MPLTNMTITSSSSTTTTTTTITTTITTTTTTTTTTITSTTSTQKLTKNFVKHLKLFFSLNAIYRILCGKIFFIISIVIMELYEHVSKMHLRALKIDWCLFTLVLERLPSADRKTPGYITPEDRHSRTRAINFRAAIPFPSVKDLVARNSKLQAMFSDAASKVAKSELLDDLDPESIVRIHSASDEGAACIQTQPTAPNRCSLEFKIF